MKAYKLPSKLYLVEHDESAINKWGCWWLVKASSKKEAIDKVYNEEAKYEDPQSTGIFKNKLEATELSKLFNEEDVYMIH